MFRTLALYFERESQREQTTKQDGGLEQRLLNDIESGLGTGSPILTSLLLCK